MAKCVFCLKPGQVSLTNMGMAHNSCRNELSRRLRAGDCTVCGKALGKNRARYAQQNHPGCYGGPGSYKGYPG